MTSSSCTRATLLAAVLCAATLHAGCDDARIGGAPDGTDDARTRAAYTRELMFVAHDATAAALLDFAAADVGSAVRRRATGWAEAGSGWSPLFDLSWQGAAVRQPWRLVPQGPMRLRVGLNDEVEAVLVREGAEDVMTLEHGDFVAAWAPHSAAQIVLREATLALGSEPIRGWLVDARFGVTAAAEAQEQREASDAEDEAQEEREASDAEVEAQEEREASDAERRAGAQVPRPDSILAADSASSGPGDIDARPAEPIDAAPARMRIRAVRAVLVADDGETLVVGQTEAGLVGWLYTAGGERTLSTLTLTRAPGEREIWSLQAGGADALTGTLLVMDEEPMPVAPRIVRGTVRIGSETLEMHGVLRPDAT